MQIEFYHWGVQCPIIHEMLTLFQRLPHDTITCYDVSEQPSLAKEVHLFFPFLTIIDQTKRYRGPITETVLEQLRTQDQIEEPYVIPFGKIPVQKELYLLNGETMHYVQQGCSLQQDCIGCQKKSDFVSQYASFYGILHMDQGRVLGGVEWLPSVVVPYDIVKREKLAFITCVYHSDEHYDYKAYPLARLEQELKLLGYEEIEVISDEIGTFPNGNVAWFQAQGYQDEGVLWQEESYACLHMMHKVL